MYDYFGRKNIEWIDLAIDRLCGVNLEIIKSYDNIEDILELNQILYRISQINLNGFEKAVRTILSIDTKNETEFKNLSLRYKLLYKIYKYLDRKITKKMNNQCC